MQLISGTCLLASLAGQALSVPATRWHKPSKSLSSFPQAATPSFAYGSGGGSGSLEIPTGADYLKGTNGVPFGWLPDSANGGTMAAINSKLGKKGAAYGWYSQIRSSNYDDSQLMEVMSDVIKSGAAFMPSVMPTGVYFSQVNSDLAQQIATSVKKYTDKGVEVWLRFAHEVNYYVTDGTYKGGSPQEFVAAWKTLHDAVKSNPKVKMYWSPNEASSASLKQWFPGAEYVDIVGIDVYPKSGATFGETYGDFYNTFAKGYNKPFVIGETGSKSYDYSSKENWLAQITGADLSQYPLYKSANWFEFYKEGNDFRVVVDQNVAETEKHFN